MEKNEKSQQRYRKDEEKPNEDLMLICKITEIENNRKTTSLGWLNGKVMLDKRTDKLGNKSIEIIQ
jgi:hypothetical protein